MYVTFGRRGGGHFIVSIEHIIAITDLADGCEVCWFSGNETFRTPIGITATDAVGLIEFEQEQQCRRDPVYRQKATRL